MEIPVGQGLVALVDDDDSQIIAAYRWHAYAQGRTHYAYACPTINGKQRRVLMHRLILGIVGEPGGVDHCNGNGLDNRRINLRLATHAENCRNRRMHRDNASGYKGVLRSKSGQSWYAQIKAEGKIIYLGSFADPLEAAWAYDQAAQRYFGAFACLNGVPLPPAVAAREQAAREQAAERERQIAATWADALAVLAAHGHTMGTDATVAGVPVRQCTVCLRTVVARDDGRFAGTALTHACAPPVLPRWNPAARRLAESHRTRRASR